MDTIELDDIELFEFGSWMNCKLLWVEDSGYLSLLVSSLVIQDSRLIGANRELDMVEEPPGVNYHTITLGSVYSPVLLLSKSVPIV